MERGREMTGSPCNPKQQLYKGKPGTILVCPACRQTMQGIHYPYGIGLVTLPDHCDPHWKMRSLGNFEPDRIYRRRSIHR
jgi:hypothetical protein